MIREVTAIQKLEQEVRVKLARKRYTSRYTMDDILGSSEEIRLLKKLAGRIAVFDQPVYIYGESGTGKELFAHAHGARTDRSSPSTLPPCLRACWKASCSATPRARSPARKGRHDRRF